MWGSGPEDVFAVGLNGELLHYDGISWLRIDSETTSALFGIWGQGRTFFVVGEHGTIYRRTRAPSLL